VTTKIRKVNSVLKVSPKQATCDSLKTLFQQKNLFKGNISIYLICSSYMQALQTFQTLSLKVITNIVSDKQFQGVPNSKQYEELTLLPAVGTKFLTPQPTTELEQRTSKRSLLNKDKTD
jgi:hypothetical protein